MKTMTTEFERSGLKFVPTSWPIDAAPLSKKRITRSSDWSGRNTCPNLAVDNGYFPAKPYSVNCWGSHPDNDEDDCWTGDDFATLAEAEAAAASWEDHFPHSYSETTHVEITAWTGNLVRGLFEHKRISVVKVKTDSEIRRMKRREAADDRQWQREIAMQAGMGMGVDAYNDAMDWG